MEQTPAPPAPLHPDAVALRAQLNAREPGYHWRSLFVMLAALILFGALAGMSFQIDGALAVLGALLLHETGHAVAMKLLGYREVRVFLVPLLGMSVEDHGRPVPPTRRGAVLLMGPLPGLLLALALVLTRAPVPKTLEWNLVLTLAGLNLINLLPLEPFDGGQLIHLELPAPLRGLDVLTLVTATAALGALAFRLHSWALGVVALLVLSTVARRINAWLVARELRKRSAALPEQIARAPEETLQFLHQAVQERVIQPSFYPKADRLLSVTAEWARMIYDRARPLPPVGTSLALLTGHLAGLALGGATLWLLFLQR